MNHGALHVVRLLDGRDGHPVLAGNGTQRLPATHPVTCVAGRLHDRGRREACGPGLAGEGQPERLGVRDGQQQAVRTVRRRGHPVEGRVERKHVVAADAREVGCVAQVDLAARIDDVEVRTIRHCRELQAVRARIGDQAADREQLRHVVARFGMQVETEEVRGSAGGRVATDRAAERALAAVIGGDREEPVALEVAVQVLQVGESRVGGEQHVAAFVDPPVLREPVVLAGAGDELPEARGTAAGIRDRVERALDHRQQRQLEGHAATLDLRDDVVQVALAATERTVEKVRP